MECFAFASSRPTADDSLGTSERATPPNVVRETISCGEEEEGARSEDRGTKERTSIGLPFSGGPIIHGGTKTSQLLHMTHINSHDSLLHVLLICMTRVSLDLDSFTNYYTVWNGAFWGILQGNQINK